MILKKSFDDLLTKISLNPTRIERIKSAHNTVRDFLKKSDILKKYYINTYLQGSYRQDTAIKPIDGDEYDVDVVLEMNWKDNDGEFKGKSEIKQKLKQALEGSEDFKYRILPHHRKRCITLDYAGDFHMDILPCHSDNDDTDTICVFDSNDEWRASHPKGFIDWINNIQKNSNSNIKYWRNIQFGEKSHPKSIILSTIIGECISSTEKSIDTALVITMEKILENYEVEKRDVPEIYNPSLEVENLSDNLSLSDYNRFINKLTKAAETARKALDEKNVEKAVELWNSKELFNCNLSNKDKDLQEMIDKTIELNKAIRKEPLNISSSGIIGVSEKSAVSKTVYSPHHRI